MFRGFTQTYLLSNLRRKLMEIILLRELLGRRRDDYQPRRTSELLAKPQREHIPASGTDAGVETSESCDDDSDGEVQLRTERVTVDQIRRPTEDPDGDYRILLRASSGDRVWFFQYFGQLEGDQAMTPTECILFTASPDDELIVKYFECEEPEDGDEDGDAELFPYLMIDTVELPL